MSFLNDYSAGWARLISSADLAVDFVFPAEDADGEQVPLFQMSLPENDGPSRGVALAPTLIGSHPTLAKSIYSFQVMSRSASEDPRDVWELDDAIQDLMLGLYPAALPGGVVVEASELTGSASLGDDASGRWKWVSNYRQRVYRPGPNRF